jgi:gamma-glutamyltranspeptidase / glutathione hydrolase
VRLARDGFVVSDAVAKSITEEKGRLARDPETALIFLPGGAPPAPGFLLRQPDLANTLATIRDRGADGFYRGEIARKIEEGQQRDGGLISRGDLGRYQALVRQPVRFRFGPAEVFTTPAPSSGPMLAELALLSGFAGLERLKAGDVASSHLLAEMEKRAFRDRNRFLGDPSFGGVRQARMTDPVRLKAIAAAIDPRRATPSDALARSEHERPTTTHFSVLDATGGAVAVTTTLNDSFGNARIAPGLGFLLNNEMDDFTTRPGRKNLYGLVQGEVNEVAPGKRMLSSMCPSIAVEGGKNVLVWGSPGGSTIPTTNFQVMLNFFLRGLPAAEAVAAPRFHQQDFPDQIEYEGGRFDVAWIEGLERMGHTVVERVTEQHHPAVLGRVYAVFLGPDGVAQAVADPREGGVGLVARPAR